MSFRTVGMLNRWSVPIGLAAGIILFVVQCYRSGRFQNQPYNHGGGPEFDGGQRFGGEPRSGGNGRNHLNDDDDNVGNNNNRADHVRPNNHTTQNRTPTPPSREDECSICRDRLIQRDPSRSYCIISLPNCGHWFHQACAMRLLEYHPSCPNCRVPIDRDSLRRTPVRVVDPNSVQHVAGDVPPNLNPSSSRNENSNPTANPHANANVIASANANASSKQNPNQNPSSNLNSNPTTSTSRLTNTDELENQERTRTRARQKKDTYREESLD